MSGGWNPQHSSQRSFIRLQKFGSPHPSHFWIGHVLQPPSTLQIAAVSSKLTKRKWKQCRECLEQFWRRLLKEYLPTLRTKLKLHKTIDQLKEGDVVGILQNNSPRGQWPIGLVERAIRGPDSEVRSCYLKTHQGRTHKPAHLLSHITSSKKTLTPNNRQQTQHKDHHHSPKDEPHLHE